MNWIPHCIEKISDPNLKEGGLNNFIDAANKLAGKPHGKHRGYVFSNAWVYNIIESICVALMIDPRGDKESACGCAGIYSAPVALESYAQVFEEEGQLERLEAFASEHGPRFYGLPLNEGTVTLERSQWSVPEELRGGGEVVIPFKAGETLAWRLVRTTG